MSRQGATLAALGLAVLLALAPGARAETPRPDLAALVAQHPDDPDLAWVYARSLVREDRFAEAAEALARLRERWPGRYPEAPFLHGRALLRAGEPETARAVVEAARNERPQDRSLELLHAAVLLHLGRDAEAEARLERVAARDPDLAPLLDGVRREGLAEGEARGPAPAPRAASPLGLEVYGGVEYDTNANVDNDALAGPREADARLVSGVGIRWRAFRGERARVHLGYRYDREDPFDLRELARDRHRLDASFQLGLSERLALLLDAEGSASRLDQSLYHVDWRVRPGLLVELGPRAGLLRLFAEAGQERFREDPVLASLERDADVYGGGAELLRGMPFWRGAFVSLELDGRRELTDGSRDLLGFESAYDRTAAGAELRVRGPLAFGVRVDASLAWEGAWFDHDNVMQALTEGRRAAAPRRDSTLASRVSLIRPLGSWLQVELSWRRFDRGSSVDVYGVESDVIGFYVTAIPW